MKKYFAIVLVLVLTMCLFAGCRSRADQDTTGAPTTAPTSRPTTLPTTTPTTGTTTAPTDSMLDDMIPGTEDTIDPTNGANQGTEGTQDRSRMIPRF